MNKSVPYIYFLIMLLLPHNSKEEWQDPHDMDFTIDFEPIKLPLKMHGNDKMQSCPSSNSNHELYIKRIINLILNSANLQKEHSTYQGQIKLTIPVDDYNYIVDFTNAKSVDIDMLKKLDAVLSNVFKKNLNEYWLEAGEKILLLLLSESTLHCVSIIGILTFVYFMHKSKYPLWFIFKYVLFLCWIYDAFVTYIHLQEEYDRHNIKILGEQCNKSYTFLEAIQNLMTGENDCKRKLLSPFTVLAEQCAHIVRPLQFVGEGLGGFASGLWGKLPWFVNIILMPVMLIFAAVIFTIFLSFGLQVPIKINILHLINLQFGFKSKTNSDNVLTESTLHKVLDAVSQKPQLVFTTQDIKGELQQHNRIEDISEKKIKESLQEVPAEIKSIENVKPIENKSNVEECKILKDGKKVGDNLEDQSMENMESKTDDGKQFMDPVDQMPKTKIPVKIKTLEAGDAST